MGAVLTEEQVTVEDLLKLPKEIRSNLATVMKLIYERKFTGTVGLNCHLGVPRSVTLPPPSIRLTDE